MTQTEGQQTQAATEPFRLYKESVWARLGMPL